MSKKVLVVVDVQKDFYHPDGALYVKGGEVLPERIAKVIPEFDDVIFTVDWHPYDHISFKNFGGVWSQHCIVFTEGASLPEDFKPFIKLRNIIAKGFVSLKEEYAAPYYKLLEQIEDSRANKYVEPSVDEIVFCGIAGDICVKSTIEEFITNVPQYTKHVKVYLDGVASIDDGTTIREFMKENNIEEWKPQE